MVKGIYGDIHKSTGQIFENKVPSAYIFRRFPFRRSKRTDQENGQSQQEDQSKHFVLFFSGSEAQT